jgi:hypothetical protein
VTIYRPTVAQEMGGDHSINKALQLSKVPLFNKAFFYIRSDEFSRRKLIIRDEIKISFPINIEMSVYSQKENQE